VTATTRETAQAYVVQPEDGRTLDELHIRFLSEGTFSAGAMTAIECVNSGPGGPPLHVHHSHDECYYVTAGRYRFEFGDRAYEGGPGTFAYAPRNTIHTFASIGPEEGRLIGFIFPAGLEGFLEKLAELGRRGAGAEEYQTVFREYDSEVVGRS
jgi:mannose-6-phosphate isomerase-like protein (cupin superfamily)